MLKNQVFHGLKSELSNGHFVGQHNAFGVGEGAKLIVERRSALKKNDPKPLSRKGLRMGGRRKGLKAVGAEKEVVQVEAGGWGASGDENPRPWLVSITKERCS